MASPSSAEIAIKILDIAKISKHHFPDTIGSHLLIIENAINDLAAKAVPIAEVDELNENVKQLAVAVRETVSLHKSMIEDMNSILKLYTDLNQKVDGLTGTISDISAKQSNVDHFVANVKNAITAP